MAKKIKKEKREMEKTSKGGEQMKTENKIVRNIVIGIFLFAICIFLVILFLKSSGEFTYQGVKFEVKKFCDSGPPCLVMYKTTLPVKSNGTDFLVTTLSQKTNDYNFYLRNDPRKLNVPFNGTLVIKKDLVFNSEEVNSCPAGAAGPNFNLLYYHLEIHVFKNESLTCDPLGRYTLITVKPGNETSIEQIGPACYNINIKDCQILEGTEKFMLETFVQINKLLNNQTKTK